MKRIVSLDIYSGNTHLEIDGLFIDFRVVRTLSSTPTAGSVKIWNLKESTARFIKEEGNQISITAGYEGASGIVYGGNIRRSSNKRTYNANKGFLERDGINYVTEIAVGGHVDKLTEAFFQRSYAGTIQAKQIIADALSQIGISAFNLQDLPAVSVDDFVWNGRTKDLVDELADRLEMAWFEDNGLAYFHAPNKSYEILPIKINPNNGLINTPEINGKGVKFECRLFPAVRPGGLVELESEYNAEANGQWKIKKVETKGSNNSGEHKLIVEGTAINES